MAKVIKMKEPEVMEEYAKLMKEKAIIEFRIKAFEKKYGEQLLNICWPNRKENNG